MTEGCLSRLCTNSLLCILLIVFNFYQIHAVRIGIKHWNDVSGQIESFQRGVFGNGAPTPCPNRAEAVLQCIGGLRSLAHWLNDSSVYGDEVLPENILRLSSGNLIGGESGWISSIDGGWAKYGELVRNHFRPHVMALGMKEFEAGLQSTMDFINKMGFGMVTLSNTCFQNESSEYRKDEIEFCDNYNIHEKVRVLTVLDAVKYVQFKIGVIGFVNPNVERFSLPGKLKFNPIVPSIQEIVNRHSKDISTFIAIGDGSLDVSKEILDTIPQVKLVIYGTGYVDEDNDREVTNKTFLVEYKHGYIAKAGRFGSSVGNLLFELDTDSGHLVAVPGRSQLVETSRPEIWNAAAQAAQSDYTKLEAQIRKLKDDVVGQSRVHLQGGNVCWRQECNLGNLVADAMVHCALNLALNKFDFHIHAIWHARALFEDEIKPGTKISRFDIHKWLPYHNQAHLVRVTGKNLKRIFEASATGIAPGNVNAPDWGQFLQISNGLEVYYDSSDGIPKVTRIRMTHDANGIPLLSDMVDNINYYLVIPTFLYEGRGTYQFAGEKGFWKDIIFDNLTTSNFAFDDDCVEGYIRALGQVSVGFEERIWVNGDPNERPSCGAGGYMIATVILTIFIFALLQAMLYASYLYLLPSIRRYFTTIQTEYPPNQL